MTATTLEPLAEALTDSQRWETLDHLARLAASGRLTSIECVLVVGCLSPLPIERAVETFDRLAEVIDSTGFDDHLEQHTQELIHSYLWVLTFGARTSCEACRRMGMRGVELHPVRPTGGLLCEYHYSQQSWVTDPRRLALAGGAR